MFEKDDRSTGTHYIESVWIVAKKTRTRNQCRLVSTLLRVMNAICFVGKAKIEWFVSKVVKGEINEHSGFS